MRVRQAHASKLLSWQARSPVTPIADWSLRGEDTASTILCLVCEIVETYTAISF